MKTSYITPEIIIMIVKLFLFLHLINSQEMLKDYKIIEWSEANDLTMKHSTQLLMNVECNLSTLYKIEDSSYLIKPLNPFGKSLLTNDLSLVNEWINECSFPTNEKEHKFYEANSYRIANLSKHREELRRELYDAVSFEIRDVGPVEIDHIYKLLKSKRKFEKYKLNFIVLIGDYLINKSSEHISWGILESKQLLNPIRYLILLKSDHEKTRYFKLEDEISGKWGDSGIQAIQHSYEQFWFRPNEFDEIRKLK